MRVKSKAHAWEVIRNNFYGVEFKQLEHESLCAGYAIYEGVVEDFFGYNAYVVRISDCDTRFEVTRMDNGVSTNLWIRPDDTLESIINEEYKRRIEKEEFDISEYKKVVLDEVEFDNKSLYQLLEEYVKLSNEDPFFDRARVLACWELINKR